jgi:hypothetical protein
MSGTALDHRLVRDYLRDLDTAMRGWPAERASELREQITAHLDEALSPDSGDAEVTATLRQLGSPGELVAESSPAGAGGVWGRLGRVRRRTWAVAGVAVVLVAAAVTYLVVTLTAPALEFNGVATWWFPRDVSHRVDTSYGDNIETTVPIRSGLQGYVVGLHNSANVTETVVGDGSNGTIVGDDGLGWDNLGGPGRVQVAVSTRYWDPPDSLGYGLVHKVRYVAGGSIPPHQTRLVRVLWTISPSVCLAKGESLSIINTVFLRVRVGVFTRTQSIPLSQVFNLTGPNPSCPR